MSGLDWLPTFAAATGDKSITDDLVKGRTLGGRNYKVHLDGYNQLDLITGAGPSRRKEVFYFAQSQLGAVRIGDWKYRFLDQPGGWFGSTVTVTLPIVSNLRLDPFERTSFTQAPPEMMEFMGHEFWRLVFVQQEVMKLAQTFVDFPPMQKGASFNLDSVKAQIDAAVRKKEGD
jgi:arylsulfatase A-like enzyme